MNHSDLPPIWNRHKKIIALIFALIIGGYSISLVQIDESAANQFYKAKESRRGKIRKAEEKKESVEFKQQRSGITRHFWIEEGKELRRQFFLTAISALAIAGKNIPGENATPPVPEKSKRSFKEVYDKPKGWFQEDLYWVIKDTGDRVSLQEDVWVRQAPPHKKIPESLYDNIIPVQIVRFYDAVSGQWDPITNRLTAQGTFFSIVKILNHDIPKDEQSGELLAKGTANEITFSLDSNDKTQVSCKGVTMHLHQGVSR
jgi:hypothetical protein